MFDKCVKKKKKQIEATWEKAMKMAAEEEKVREGGQAERK